LHTDASFNFKYLSKIQKLQIFTTFLSDSTLDLLQSAKTERNIFAVGRSNCGDFHFNSFFAKEMAFYLTSAHEISCVSIDQTNTQWLKSESESRLLLEKVVYLIVSATTELILELFNSDKIKKIEKLSLHDLSLNLSFAASLKRLDLVGCASLLSLESNLKIPIESLLIRSCSNYSLPDISKLSNSLTDLQIIGHSVDLTGIGKLNRSRKLKLQGNGIILPDHLRDNLECLQVKGNLRNSSLVLESVNLKLSVPFKTWKIISFPDNLSTLELIFNCDQFDLSIDSFYNLPSSVKKLLLSSEAFSSINLLNFIPRHLSKLESLIFLTQCQFIVESIIEVFEEFQHLNALQLEIPSDSDLCEQLKDQRSSLKCLKQIVSLKPKFPKVIISRI
jgi:hypothetical protein